MTFIYKDGVVNISCSRSRGSAFFYTVNIYRDIRHQFTFLKYTQNYTLNYIDLECKAAGPISANIFNHPILVLPLELGKEVVSVSCQLRPEVAPWSMLIGLKANDIPLLTVAILPVLALIHSAIEVTVDAASPSY